MRKKVSTPVRFRSTVRQGIYIGRRIGFTTITDRLNAIFLRGGPWHGLLARAWLCKYGQDAHAIAHMKKPRSEFRLVNRPNGPPSNTSQNPLAYPFYPDTLLPIIGIWERWSERKHEERMPHEHGRREAATPISAFSPRAPETLPGRNFLTEGCRYRARTRRRGWLSTYKEMQDVNFRSGRIIELLSFDRRNGDLCRCLSTGDNRRRPAAGGACGRPIGARHANR